MRVRLSPDAANTIPLERLDGILNGGDAFVEIRPALMAMVVAMEHKLRKNDHKTGWRDQPIEAHIKLLKIELMEFDVALEFLGDQEAANECVDIANFAMIIRDKLLARIAAGKGIVSPAARPEDHISNGRFTGE